MTICVTSCARLDLLEETIASFRAHNSGGCWLINDDSGETDVVEKLRADYPFADVLPSSERIGLMGSIDRLYSRAQTDFIFHLEDDWYFDGPVAWESATSLLSSDETTSNVCVRSSDEMKPRFQRASHTIDHDGTSYRIVPPSAHPEFHGWSSNPGLIRRALYQDFSPFALMLHDQMSGRIKRAGFHMAYQLPGVARHAGQGRNITEPGQPPRPTTKLGKVARGVRKRLYYMGVLRDPF